MHARVRLALIALTICAVAAVIGATLALERAPSAEPQLTNGWAGAIRPAGLAVPAFALRDQAGDVVDSASLNGRPTVFAFVYSTCEDVCPAQVQTIRSALDQLDAGDGAVNVVGISVDPANDTPKRAETFLVAQSMTGRMRFLLGTRAELEPIWKGFGIQPQTAALDHSAHVVLADARGIQRIGFPYEHLTTNGLAHDLARLAAH